MNFMNNASRMVFNVLYVHNNSFFLGLGFFNVMKKKGKGGKKAWDAKGCSTGFQKKNLKSIFVTSTTKITRQIRDGSIFCVI